MKARIARFAALLAACALVAQSAVAHHSTNGLYNEDVMVELKGTVKAWRFINPHPSLKLEVIDDKGVMHVWDVSYGGSAVSHLRKRGYSATTFKPGETIIVKGHPTVLADAYGLLMETEDPRHEDGTPFP